MTYCVTDRESQLLNEKRIDLNDIIRNSIINGVKVWFGDMVLIVDGNAYRKKDMSFLREKKYVCDHSRYSRSNNRDCSLRAHLFLSYHLI